MTFILSFSVQGQDKFMPTSMRIGADATAIGQSIFDPSLNYFEINTDMIVHKYIVSFDYGAINYVRNFNSEGTNADYSNQGHYFRLGADLNLIPNDKENNAVFVGLRYARSFFNETLNTSITDQVYGSYDQDLANPGMRSGWFEFVGGMKVRVVNNIFFGYTLRYKFQRSRSPYQDFIPHDIPGFGKESSKNAFAFNYHIFYQIPFKKKPAKIVTLP